MKFIAKSNEQLIEELLIPKDTEVEFKVLEAEEKKSASNNDMFAIKLAIYQNGTNKGNLYDYLLYSGVMAFKFRHFFESTGRIDMYNSEEVQATELIGLTGWLKIGVQAAKNGYPAKNNIADYLDKGIDGRLQQTAGGDDIPF